MNTTRQRSSRMIWLLFLAGPVIWFAHFMGVYLLAEAVCASREAGPRVLGVDVVSFVTLVATALAVATTSLLAVVAYRVWRAERDDSTGWLDGDDLNPGLALAGALLGALFVVAILFVGVPAAVLDPC